MSSSKENRPKGPKSHPSLFDAENADLRSKQGSQPPRSQPNKKQTIKELLLQAPTTLLHDDDNAARMEALLPHFSAAPLPSAPEDTAEPGAQLEAEHAPVCGTTTGVTGDTSQRDDEDDEDDGDDMEAEDEMLALFRTFGTPCWEPVTSLQPPQTALIKTFVAR